MISMITCRDELYKRLWLDYRDNKHNSFFYRYMKRKKDAQAQRISEIRTALEEYRKRTKPDKYVLLRAYYLAYKSAIVTEEEFIQRFVEITGTKKRRKNEPLDAGINADLSREDYNARFFEIIGAKKRRMYESITPELIDEVEQAYERTFLTGCISDCFINMGYRAAKVRDPVMDKDDIVYVKKGEKYTKAQDGYINDLDLWAAYYYDQLDKGEQQYTPRFVSELTDDYIRKCESLFKELNKENRTQTFVPLYFDSTCGAGVIIIGSEMLPPMKQNGKTCRICVMYFSYPDDEISGFDQIPISMMTDLYDDVYNAFDKFKEGVATLEFAINYRYYNLAFPDKIADIFSSFFLEKEQKAAVSPLEQELVDEASKQLKEWVQENADYVARTGILSR